MESIKKGLKVGLNTTFELGKIIFPITLIVTILSQTVLMDWLIIGAEPFMSWLGLPGEAAIPLVLGNFLNLYAAIGAILTMDLTVKHVFILAVMLSFSHNLLIESSVAAKVGINMWIVMFIRVGLAILSAVTISLVWKGGNELAVYGMVPKTPEEVAGIWNIAILGVKQAVIGIIQLALIVIPLMIGIQIMKDRNWLNVFSKWMSPFTRMLGMKENTSTTMAAGIAFGLAFGAGVMMQAVKEDGVEKKDLYLAFIFLVSCHAVVEDTLLFIPLGIPVWPLFLTRLITAVVLTIIVAVIWNSIERNRQNSSKNRKRKEAV